jgi:putative membrane protein
MQPTETRSPARLLRHFAHGLLMGAADVVPGVSGGTVALIVGIYERLVASVRAAASGRLRDIEWGLVLPLAGGILVALVVGANVIPPLIERYPVQTRALFFGLIAASVAIPWRRVDDPGGRAWLLAAIGAVAAFVLVGLPERAVEDPSLLRVFASAAVAIIAMILPGVSGAFLLLVLGLYEVTLRAVSSLDLAYIGVFAIGAVVGLGLFSRVLGWLLDHRHDATMAVLVGLMVGSLRALWPWQGDDRGLQPPEAGLGLLVTVALAIVGFALVRALVRFGEQPRAREPANRSDA